jgi:uncharacterized membrane protein YgcG
MKLIKSTILVLVMAVATFSQIPPRIEGTFIQDHANVLTSEQRVALDQKVRTIGKNIELGFATVTTTGDRDIFEYSLEMARSYGVGSKDGEHRGIFVLFAMNDRKNYIQVSRHLESVYTDGRVAGILVSVRPLMRKGDYYGAFNSVVDQLISLSAQVDSNEQQNIVSDQQSANPAGNFDGSILVDIALGLVILGLLGAVAAFFIHRRNEKILQRELALAEAERQQYLKEQRIREEQARKEREAWLKTPEGIAETKRREELRLKEEARRKEEARLAAIAAKKERERYAAWAASPAGIAQLAREKKEREEAEERARRRREEEDNERRRRQRESSYSSSSFSSSSSDSSFGGSFGGSSDFGGGGGGSSW